jgi:predicted AlkP superfamily pyrophosphatase or phosphodiesterase
MTPKALAAILLRMAAALVIGASPSLVAANADRHVVLISIDGFPAYLWHDSAIPLPNLRKLAASGVAAKAMSIVNPTITWPNHTTLVTGVTPQRHGVLYNAWVGRDGPGHPIKRDQWVDRDRLVRVPTVYDAAHAAGLTTAESDWVAITRAPTINWSFAELPDPENPLVKEMVAAGVATREEVAAAANGKRNIVWRDEMWLRAGRFVFERHRPNLLLLHFLNTDSSHHRYGPGSLAGTSALALADRLVGEMLRAIDASGVRDRTTVMIVSDHGFKKVSKYVYPNVVLKKAGYLKAAGARVVSCDAYAGTQGGMAFVYITDPSRREEMLPRLMKLFQQTEGVDRVIDGNQGPSLDMPLPSENEAMGDIVLFAKPGFAMSGGAAGELSVAPTTDYNGTHGFPSSDPELDAIFIAAGAGIKRGIEVDRVRNLDVAPTIAHLLDVPLPTADGRIMKEILE